MKALAIIQARMGSTRLPGKVMLPLGGKPVLQRVIERAAPLAGDGNIYVATTHARPDDAIADLCQELVVPCVRYGVGPAESDVHARFLRVLDRYPCDAFWRVTADCPLFGVDIGTQAMALLDHTGVDYVGATVASGYIDGLDIEAVRSASFRALAPKTMHEREHVTPAFGARTSMKAMQCIPEPAYAHPDWRLTLDTLRDYERLQEIWGACANTCGDVWLPDAVEWLRLHPEWRGNVA